MSTDIAESLPKRKFAPAPMIAKGAKGKSAPPSAKGGKAKGASEEGSEKRIRQAVYDIRYRARREDIDLKAAFAQYMSNSSLSQADRTAVREKIFGKKGGISEKFINGADDLAVDGVASALYKVFVEKKEEEKELELAYLQQLDEQPTKKYKVRVTDKNGRSYVRFADRAKITELRGNPNIESVEMTEYGEPYEGERKKGRMTARAKAGKGLDPVGKEDKDIDNDGDHDKTDKYLLKRRKAIGAAIRKKADKKIKEAYLADGTISTEPKAGTQKITGKNPDGTEINNYATGSVVLNPDDGSKPVKKVGVYAHLELKGNSLSEAQKKMIEMYDSKKKEMKKKDKISDMITKDSVKKDDEEKEEKPDTRGMYAKINLIKNKLRAAGQRDPMVMAVDACEETVDEGIGSLIKGGLKAASKVTKLGQKTAVGVGGLGVGVGGGKLLDDARKEGKKKNSMKTEERTPAKGDDSFKEFREGGSKFRGDKTKKPSEPSKPKEEEKPDMGSKPQSSPSPSPEVKGNTPTKPSKPQKKKPPYNPYGTGTANPTNMSGSTGP